MVPHSPILARLFACTALAAALAVAQVRADDAPATADTAPAGLFSQDTLTNNWFGMAATLKDKGIVLGATETSEVLGVVSGGTSTGTIYEGRLELDLDLDLDHILGLANTVLHANAYQIHGRGLSANYLGGNLQTASSIEATRATRLFDLWVERGFFDSALSVRIGQIAADDEFFTSQYASGLINATFGWPAIMAQALPVGGPAYPLATPGIRVKYAFSNAVALQAAIFNGDPSGGDTGDAMGNPQVANSDGLRFPIDHGPFVIAELSYAPGATGNGSPATVYKLGVWRQGGRFDDLAADDAGRSLADPASDGRPRPHAGNFGIYAVADMSLYQPADNADGGLSGFLRLGGDPDDRNLIDVYADGGLVYKGPFADRTDDAVSLGLSYAGVGGPAGALVHSLQQFSAVVAGAPDHQTVLEASYSAILAPWWSAQPDFQLVLHPAPVQLRPTAATVVGRAANAVVLGLRTSIRF
jgi:porin